MRSPLLEQMADPVEILQRLDALRGAGLQVPGDLSRAVVDWVSAGAAPILAGEPVADALGLRAERGAWQNSPIHRARLQAREKALQALWDRTSPLASDAERARQIVGWADAWSALNSDRLTGAQAREVFAVVPPDTQAHLDDLADTGLRVPNVRQLLRVIRGGSHGVSDTADRGFIDSNAPQSAAIEH